MRNTACFRIVTTVGLATALLETSLFAGSRIAPVAARCPPELAQRVVDAEGENDRCVAREAPTCPPGTALRADGQGEADVCDLAGSTEAASSKKVKAPKCRGGFRLRVGQGRDACEKTAPPLCPSGAILKTVQGEDQCRY
jgi:hypothetical protein